METEGKVVPSDGEMIRRFLANDPDDPDAFRLIVDRYEEPVSMYLTRYFKLSHRAADVAQETFIRLYQLVERRPGVWPVDESIEPLVMFIAARAAVDYIRTERYLRTTDTKFAVLSADQSSWKEADAWISAIGIDVQRALAALPPSLQKVARLYFLENHTRADVAEMTQSTVKAAKGKISRARQLLTRHLQRYLKGAGHDVRISAAPGAGPTVDEVSARLR